jgi:hypothetical protein
VILPSKKVLSIFIVVAAMVAAIIIGFGRDKASSAINYTANLVAGEKVSLPENPNWQNELGGAVQNAEPVQTQESASVPETTTDTISKALMSNYLALKQSGTLDQTSTQKLIDQTVDYVGTSGSINIETPKLNIIPDNGRQSITDYGENLGNILKNNRPKEIIDERAIISDAVNSENSSKIDELGPVIAVYEKIASDLTKIPVPQTFVKAHIDMTNGAASMALGLQEVKVVFNDPVKGLAALQLYGKGLATFSQALKATSIFIDQNKIIYKQGSGGYYLL